VLTAFLFVLEPIPIPLKQLVLLNGTADREAPIVPPHGGARHTREIIEVVVGVQLVVAEEVLGGAVQRVGTTTGNNADFP